LICRKAGADCARQAGIRKRKFPEGSSMSHRMMLILAAVALAAILLVALRQHGAL
jgi:hypothetical protein